MKKILALLSSIFFIGCSKPPNINEYTKYTVASGKHNSIPIATKVFFQKCNVSGSAYFTNESVYNLNGEDQLDWNKLSGFKLDYNSIPDNAAMIVWRYNVQGDYFEIAPYFNNYGIVFPVANQIIKVNKGDVFSWQITLSGDLATINIHKGTVVITKKLKLKKAGLFTSVSLWFGGNKTAPNNVSVYIKL